MTIELIIIGAIFAFCAAVQSAVGFAFSLFSNTLFLLAGIPLPETILLSALGSALQRTVMTFNLWQHVEWRKVIPLRAVCAITLPIGIFTLRHFANLDTNIIKIAMGLLVLTILTIQIVWRVNPKPHLHWAWGVVAATTSGFLNGVSNNGGPPLILWVHAHDWPPGRSRVTTMAITMLLTPLQLALLFFAFGRGITPPMAQIYMLIPAILIGTAIGLNIGKHLSRSRLRLIALTLLAIISITAIAEPLLR